MNEEMKIEAMELCVTACEKHGSNNEVHNAYIHSPLILIFLLHQNAAKMIKDTMDKKFGPTWHAVVGEGFGFDITHDCRHLLYMFFGGSIAICLWKCA